MDRHWQRLGDALAGALAETASIDDAHSLIREYHKMRMHCLSRSSCVGCEYFHPNRESFERTHHELSACLRISTDDVIRIAASVIGRKKGAEDCSPAPSCVDAN